MKSHRVHLWAAAIFAQALVLALLYPDSYQQDGGYHFLFARWSWRHPDFLVGTWTRPLFTALYSIPAQLGYLPARLLTGFVLAATGGVTFRLAQHFGFRRPWLAYPLLMLHPNVLLLSFDTLTEPLFALFVAAGLLLHVRGRPLTAAAVISFLPTIRPEGFFVGIFWGVLMLLDARLTWRWPKTLILLAGTFVWCLASWIITGDPLYVIHTWPWTGRDVYGHATLGWYGRVGFEFAGPVVLLLSLAGWGREVRRRRWALPLLAAYFFAFQAVLWQFGLFASAGYARYFVCIAPVTSLLALSAIEAAESRLKPPLFAGLLAGSLVFAWIFALHIVDCHKHLHDARAVREMHDWYRANGNAPVRRLVWSQAYMCILFDTDLTDRDIQAGYTREKNLECLRESPPGTLIFWDADTGPSWYHVGADDFEGLGFRRLRSQKYRLQPLWAPVVVQPHCGPREQEMHLFYKDVTGARE